MARRSDRCTNAIGSRVYKDVIVFSFAFDQIARAYITKTESENEHQIRSHKTTWSTQTDEKVTLQSSRHATLFRTPPLSLPSSTTASSRSKMRLTNVAGMRRAPAAAASRLNGRLLGAELELIRNYQACPRVSPQATVRGSRSAPG